MQYDSFLVSLYDNLCEDKKPCMFVVVSKRFDKCYFKFQQALKRVGYLLLYYNDKVYIANVRSNIVEGELLEYIFKQQCSFCFFDGKNKYFGNYNMANFESEIMPIFENKIQNIIDKQASYERLKYNRNFVSESLTTKVFGKTPLEFFRHTENQLVSLFSSFKKASELEKILPFSRFVQVGSVDKMYVGVVYKNSLPYAIGIGFYLSYDTDKLVSGNTYQFFQDADNKNGGYFLTFRSASDGDIVWV